MTRKGPNPDFLGGVPELLVLQLLARRAMHGYELVRSIERETGAVLDFGEGCIYPVLHRLEASGYLAACRESVGGRSRVVYRLTASGSKRLDAVKANWKEIAAAVAHVLEGETHERPALA